MTASRCLVLAAALLALGCNPRIKLSYPLTSKEYGSKVALTIALHVADTSHDYIETGQRMSLHYTVYYGDALEANASHAFASAFERVAILQRFPPDSAPPPKLALDVAIKKTALHPGAATFSLSEATVDLIAKLAIDGVVQADTIEVQGTGEGSPGILGAVPFFWLNYSAYDSALQEACETALGDALEKLVDASIARVASTP